MPLSIAAPALPEPLAGVSRRTALVSVAAACMLPALARAARQAAGPGTDAARPPLLLAQDADADMAPTGWLVSEKLDGVRAHWDGRALRLRSGLPVPAPAAWLAHLPEGVALDGELWMARGAFDAVSAMVRASAREGTDAAWERIGYHLFELPDGAGPFSARAAQLQDIARRLGGPLQAVPQREVGNAAELARWLTEVTTAGGEGLMLHRADAPYQTGRSPLLRKLKPLHDGEGQVIGHLPGQGRLAGMLGALQVRTPQGQVFALGSGLSDAMRRSPPAIGSWVTYRYRGLTAGGLPRFATFWRLHDPRLA